MVVIGSAHGVELRSPDDAYFSYFNSPYIGHSLGSAIDIYPRHDGWSCQIESPIDGCISKIKKMGMGLEKQFPTSDHDFGVAIKPEGSGSDIVRILHVEPKVTIGEKISVGDHIGTALRSRYFNYWTGPHYHVEVMDENSFNRSSQSYPLEIPFEYVPTKRDSICEETNFEVRSVSKDSIIGYPTDLNHLSIGRFHGISAFNENGSRIGILDGGISHYKHGGVIGSQEIVAGATIELEGIKIGSIAESMQGASYFHRNSLLTPLLNGDELLGISCFIYPKRYTKRGIPQIVLVPKRYAQFDGQYKEGDILTLVLRGDSNSIKTR